MTDYNKAHAPTEDAEQAQIIYWCANMSIAHPELALIYHVPNEGKRSKAAAANMQRIGLKSGVPDLCLPVAKGKYHGLYIELKRVGGRVTETQVDWLLALSKQGYAVCVCYGAEQAIDVISAYICDSAKTSRTMTEEQIEALRPKHRKGHGNAIVILGCLMLICSCTDIAINGDITGISLLPLIPIMIAALVKQVRIFGGVSDGTAD